MASSREEDVGGRIAKNHISLARPGVTLVTLHPEISGFMYTKKPNSDNLASDLEQPHLDEVNFHGDSLRVLRRFPEGVKDDLGYALYQLQVGETPLDSKPMPGVGDGIFELCEQDERAWYRAIYYRKIKGVIHVLHCFEKQTNKTEQRDIETARLMLARLLKELRETERDAKTQQRKRSRSGKRSR